MRSIPERWRFSYDSEDLCLGDLSWPEAVRLFRASECGRFAAQADGECVTLEFNATHAAVLYMGRDGVDLRPYLPHRPAEAQDLATFFCKCCGIRLGDQDEFLARFVGREAGFRLFEAALAGPTLPEQLPDPRAGQPVLPGLERMQAELTAERSLEWRPLPSEEYERKGGA